MKIECKTCLYKLGYGRYGCSQTLQSYTECISKEYALWYPNDVPKKPEEFISEQDFEL